MKFTRPGATRDFRAAASIGALALVAVAWRAGAAVPPGSGAGSGAASSPPRAVSYVTRTMGTYAQVVLVTADSASSSPLARRAHAVFARVDSLMSNWTTTSEVARLNRVASSGSTPVHPEVARVIDASLRLWEESDGAFDITVEPLVRLWGFLGGQKRVPSDQEITAILQCVGAGKVDFDRASRTVRFETPDLRIDLGGIAKGYAVDVAADSLKARGVDAALVDLSGNMVAIGHPAGSDAWRIGIRDPRDRLQHFARLRIRDEAISTSGQYEQFVAADGKSYGHILDPHDGRPAEGLISVTVVASTALTCDAWDTPLFVLGPEAARRKARERDDIEVVLVVPGEAGVDTVWVERSLEERFVLEREAQRFFVIRTF